MPTFIRSNPHRGSGTPDAPGYPGSIVGGCACADRYAASRMRLAATPSATGQRELCVASPGVDEVGELAFEPIALRHRTAFHSPPAGQWRRVIAL